MGIPEGLLENTAAAFALLSFLLSLAGMAACLALYMASYVALSSIDATVTPQFDSAQSALFGASAALSSAADAASHANGTMSSVSLALQSCSDSASALSSTLSGLSSLPLVDPGLAEASIRLSQASQQFANASQSASQMSASASASTAQLQETALGINLAASNLSKARQSFKSSLSSISWLSLIFCLCLAALFSSVAFSSLSVLLSHYPNMLERAEKEAAGRQKKQ